MWAVGGWSQTRTPTVKLPQGRDGRTPAWAAERPQGDSSPLTLARKVTLAVGVGGAGPASLGRR